MLCIYEYPDDVTAVKYLDPGDDVAGEEAAGDEASEAGEEAASDFTVRPWAARRAARRATSCYISD
jgi:hypothetical protein